MWNEAEIKLKQNKFVSVLFQTPAHVKRNWNKTLKQLWIVLDLFQSCFRPRLRWLFQRFVSHVRGAETKQCRRWSAEIKQICFSFVSVLFQFYFTFQFHFTCASGLSRLSCWRPRDWHRVRLQRLYQMWNFGLRLYIQSYVHDYVLLLIGIMRCLLFSRSNSLT